MDDVRHYGLCLLMILEAMAMVVGTLTALPFVIAGGPYVRRDFSQRLNAWLDGFADRWEAETGEDLRR